MMIPKRPALERRVLDALDGGTAGSAARIPVVLGGCGSGRSALLLRLRDLLGRNAAQYVDVERVATTPERFLRALHDSSPFPSRGAAVPADQGARDAFAAALAYLSTARGSAGGPVTFLLDEFLEVRTFESFPGLRTVLRDLIAALAASDNRFVLTTRYSARAHRLLRDLPACFEMVPVAPLTTAEVRATLQPADPRGSTFKDDEEDAARDELAATIQSLADGRPAYARLIAEATSSMRQRGSGDPVGALSALIAPGGQLASACRFCYELRLHRARGYGALKAILDVLAEQEPLTLTEIALRLRRTPGSTKDYLSWLEDVDLIVSRQKRYSFADPMLRLWVRLHCRPTPPSDDAVAREVHTYVASRLPRVQPALALAGPRTPGPEKSWGIIEID
jgi:hypothetical protein